MKSKSYKNFKMVPENISSKLIVITKLVIKFTLGTILGLLMAGFVYDNFTFSTPELKAIQIIISIAFVLFCGVQSAISGYNIIGELLKAFFEIVAIGR
jgi:hypothetical protein